MAAAYQEILVRLVGGLNTAENPSQLDPDELQEMTGLEYRPPRTGIFGTPGRLRYDTGTAITGNTLSGLVFAQFDVSASGTSGSGQRIIAFSGASAFGMIATGATAVPATIKRDLTAGASAYADGVHYGNNWFFWNGVDQSWAIYGTNMTASAKHGLFAVTGVFNIVATPTSVSGQTPDLGIYEAWCTEHVDANAGPADVPSINSIFGGTVGSVNLSATASTLQWTYPAAVSNTSNVFFRVYLTLPNGKFPYGYCVNVFDPAATANTGATNRTVFGLNYCPIASSLAALEPYAVVQPPAGVGVSQNGRPPIPFDWAVFQDSLVTIDATDRQLIKYSEADKPHAFPSVNFIPFETEIQDKLTALEVCNNALLVFSSFYGYRIDDLPRANDGEDIFSGRSRAKEPFSHNHGCIGPRATAVFDIFGSGQLCMFVCRDGIHITDGFKTDYASNNLDWDATIEPTRLYRCTLKNNPLRHRVEFYYFDTSFARQRLDFYYHPKFLKHGDGLRAFPTLPIGGPTPVPGVAAALGTVNDSWKMWNGGDNQFNGQAAIWLEGTGTADDSQEVDLNGSVYKRLRTKDFYLAGTNAEFAMPHAYINQAATTASGSGTATLYARYDEQGTYTATATVDFSKTQSQPLRFSGAKVAPDNRMQAASVRVVKDDGGAWQELNYLVLVVDRAGKVKSAASNV